MLEDIVVSQEMGKKLKEKGWNKLTVFVYEGVNLRPWPLDYDSELGAITPAWDELLERKFIFFPAPTAEEILHELPEDLTNQGWLHINKIQDGWRIDYAYPGCLITRTKNKFLSEAAAQMWLWCRETGYITEA